MDLKPGYKHTDAGVIPEEWDAVPLGDLFKFKNGLNKAIEYFGHGTPIVNYMDVYKKRGLYVKDLEGLVCLSSQEIKNFNVRKGDVFFTRTSETLEEVGLTSVMLDEPKDTVFSGFILRARPKNDSLDDHYKRYCFSTDYMRREITSKGTHTTRALTNGRILSAIRILRPPILEQKAIAITLNDVDVLIDSLEKLIAKKRDIKQAAMQELLTGKKRLLGFDGMWVVKKLGDLGFFLKGSGIRKDESLSGNLPSIRYGEIYTTHNFYIKTFSSWISKRVAANSRRISCGDILFASSGETKEEIGKCVAFVDDIEAYAGGDITILRPVGVNSPFLGYYLNSAPINLQKASRGQGDAVVHISSVALSNIEITIPESLEEQTAIATVFTEMDVEIDALVEKLSKLRNIKQGMMENLITGRIRLT